MTWNAGLSKESSLLILLALLRGKDSYSYHITEVKGLPQGVAVKLSVRFCLCLSFLTPHLELVPAYRIFRSSG